MAKGMARWIPALDWLVHYEKDNLKGDLAAGFTVAVMLIPQGMAYAMLAGLPPIIGLYASIIPLAVYALLGTSRQLAVGPVAMVSLLVVSGVRDLNPANTTEFIALAVGLSLLVGIIQLSMGLFRLGFLVNFLSHPVISGFTSAAAIVIGLSQLKHLLGINLKRSHHLHTIVIQASQKITGTHLLTFGIGLGGIILLFALKRWKPAFPGALAVVLISTLLVWGFGLHNKGVAIVGHVPKGFPPFGLPKISFASLQQLIPTALAISLVGFMESFAVAKGFANKNRTHVDANQELIALGAANLAGAMTQAYPVTGGFSRTAVNAQAGARTGLASLLTAGLIAFTLLFLTSFFTYLPKAILASIIIVACYGLIDLKEISHLWKVKRIDAFLLTLTFLATLFIGIKQGIGIGVISSLVMVVYRSTQPHSTELGKLPQTEIYRNLKHYPDAELNPNLIVFRMDAALYFANTAFLKDQVNHLLALRETPPKAFILDASSINDIDSSAVTALEEIERDLKERGIQLYIASAKGPVRNVLEKAHFTSRLPEPHFPFTIQQAADQAFSNHPS